MVQALLRRKVSDFQPGFEKIYILYICIFVQAFADRLKQRYKGHTDSMSSIEGDGTLDVTNTLDLTKTSAMVDFRDASKGPPICNLFTHRLNIYMEDNSI